MEVQPKSAAVGQPPAQRPQRHRLSFRALLARPRPRNLHHHHLQLLIPVPAPLLHYARCPTAAPYPARPLAWPPHTGTADTLSLRPQRPAPTEPACPCLLPSRVSGVLERLSPIVEALLTTRASRRHVPWAPVLSSPARQQGVPLATRTRHVCNLDRLLIHIRPWHTNSSRAQPCPHRAHPSPRRPSA